MSTDLTPEEKRAQMIDRMMGLDRQVLENEYLQMHDNLTTTQARCTELIQELRALKRDREDPELAVRGFDRYQRMAERSSSHVGQSNDSTWNDRLLMACMGIGGEGGEVTDLMKKLRFHGHAFDRTRMIKELGDVLWYIAEAGSAMGVSLSEIATANIAKLLARYPDGFASAKSIERKAGDT